MWARAVRTPAAIVLLCLSVLSITLAPVAVWGRDLVLNTDGFVATTAPLASDPGVQGAVVDAVTRQVDDHLDIKGLISQVLPPRAAAALSGPIKAAIQNLVTKVTTDFVRSEQFRQLWTTLLRLVHQQVDNLLAGSTLHGIVQVHGDNLVLDLSMVVTQVKQRLVAAGVGIAAHVPTFGATIVIARLNSIQKIQGAVRLLDALAAWLPWVGLVLLAASILVATWRRRALLAGALGVCAGMALVQLGLLVGKQAYLSALPGTAIPAGVATTIFDTMVSSLRLSVRVIFVVALVVASVGTWLFGTSSQARALRALIVRGVEALPLQPLAVRVTPFALPLRIGIVAAAVLVALFQNSFSAPLLISLAVVVVALEGFLQLLVATDAHVATVSGAN